MSKAMTVVTTTFKLTLHVAGLLGIAWLIWDHHKQTQETQKKHEKDLNEEASER